MFVQSISYCVPVYSLELCTLMESMLPKVGTLIESMPKKMKEKSYNYEKCTTCRELRAKNILILGTF